MRVRILLADDHKMIRRGIRRLLSDEPEFEVVGEADNGARAIELTSELNPDVVVMDVEMPDLDGVDATRQITARYSTVKVICLSAHSDQRTAGNMIDAGATGYVLKDSAFDELTDAIRTVVRGRVYLSPAVTQVLVGEFRQARAESGTSRDRAISDREREVLRLISEGKATKQVAALLGVSLKTAESHRRNLMLKLKVDSVAELTKYALRKGITTL